jgi:hypothetical protein
MMTAWNSRVLGVDLAFRTPWLERIAPVHCGSRQHSIHDNKAGQAALYRRTEAVGAAAEFAKSFDAKLLILHVGEGELSSKQRS